MKSTFKRIRRNIMLTPNRFKHKLPKKISSVVSSLSKRHLLIFVIVFALIGSVVLYISLANPNPNLTSDLSGDNKVDITDLSILLTNYGTTSPLADINSSGTVDVIDLSTLLSHWGDVYNPGAGTMGRFGYSVHIGRMSDKETYVNYAVSSNAKTVRDDFMWSQLEPAKKGIYDWSASDSLMTITAQHGLDLLAMVGYAPPWASGCSTTDKCGPTNVNDYADFVRAVASRYGPNGTFWTLNPSLPKNHPLLAIEIWNEPNIQFWVPHPDPVKYAAMLKAAYTAIKAVNPQIQVISAGLAPYKSYGMVDSTTNTTKMNPLSFLEQMYQAWRVNGSTNYLDAVGWHPYNWSAGNYSSWMLAYNIASAWSQMNDTTKEPAPNNVSVRSLMSANGDSAKKIWATEVGVPTIPNGIPESEQALFATNSVSLWKGFTWAGNYYWYDLRDDTGCLTTDDVECHFGAIRNDSPNTFKPAYDNLKNSFPP